MRTRSKKYPRVTAVYSFRSTGRNAGNAFVEALRSLEPQMSLLDRFTVAPRVPGHIDRTATESERLEDLHEIGDWVYSRPSYERGAKHYVSALYETYHPRDPLDLDEIRRKAMLAQAVEMDSLVVVPEWSTARGIAVFGQTGSGKTTFLDVMSAPYQVVIEHTTYKGVRLDCVQIPVLSVHAPHDGTLKAFQFQFFDAVDKALGEPLYGPQVRRTASIGEAVLLMGKVIAATNIGMIIFEDLQNLRSAQPKFVEHLLNILSQVLEIFGCSLAVSGTPAITDLVVRCVRNIRKIVQGGDIRLGPMAWNGAEMIEFQDQLWKYQWVRDKARLTPGIRQVWWKCSGGNPAFMKMVFIFAQRMEIGRDEVLTEDSFLNAYMYDMALLHPAIEALVSGKASEMSKFDDLIFDEQYEKMLGREAPRAPLTSEEFAELGLETQTKQSTRPRQRRAARVEMPKPGGGLLRTIALPILDPRALA